MPTNTGRRQTGYECHSDHGATSLTWDVHAKEQGMLNRQRAWLDAAKQVTSSSDLSVPWMATNQKDPERKERSFDTLLVVKKVIAVLILRTDMRKEQGIDRHKADIRRRLNG